MYAASVIDHNMTALPLLLALTTKNKQTFIKHH